MFEFFIFVLGKYTPQYKWLEKEFPKVNREETPWLIVLMHSPIYSSYVDHYMEGETVRVMYEKWFVKYKVDVVFAGHVHAYERSVSSPFSPLDYIAEVIPLLNKQVSMVVGTCLQYSL